MSFSNEKAKEKRVKSFEMILDAYKYLENKSLSHFYLGEKPSVPERVRYFEIFPRKDEGYRYILVTCAECSIETVLCEDDDRIQEDSFVPHSDHYDLFDYLESLK